ncbi:hypothetical protein Taro_000972 [Colocasia esculenta]|uniref:AP2/ERF domain-containing protein n=1 Tax=Colocasia esculenta TaxID=4460 RepID=A0A843TGE4_COLES|nr:hypothetical protein [Colocasia esculenta]
MWDLNDTPDQVRGAAAEEEAYASPGGCLSQNASMGGEGVQSASVSASGSEKGGADSDHSSSAEDDGGGGRATVASSSSAAAMAGTRDSGGSTGSSGRRIFGFSVNGGGGPGENVLGESEPAVLVTHQFFPMAAREFVGGGGGGDSNGLGEFAAVTALPLPRAHWVGVNFCQKPALGVAGQPGTGRAAAVEAPQPIKKSRRGPRSRSSQYRGVTFYRRTGRWESHIWDCGKQADLTLPMRLPGNSSNHPLS